MASLEPRIRYDFTPFDGTPGQHYDKFEERLLNAATARTDDRGWSLADHFLGNDEGGPTGPAFPGGGPGLLNATNAYRKRLKESYGLLTKHITDADHITEMRSNYFQNGHDAFESLRTSCSMPINQIRLREMDKEWDALDIMTDVGVNAYTIQTLCKKIRTLNGLRPAGHKKSFTQMTERRLECIFTSSKHFSEGAIIEYNAFESSLSHLCE